MVEFLETTEPRGLKQVRQELRDNSHEALYKALFLAFFKFFYLQRIVENEPNLVHFPAYMYRRSDTENVSSVCLVVREKIGSQTDRDDDNISVFVPMKTAWEVHHKIDFRKMKWNFGWRLPENVR